MDVVWLQGVLIVNIADTFKRFQKANVFRGKRPAHIWKLVVECWIFCILNTLVRCSSTKSQDIL